MKELFDQPEYLHLLVNPFLTHALPLAAVALLIALLSGNRGALRLALAVVVIGAAAVWPAVHFGRLGYDRIESVADETGGEWLEVHRHRAEDNAWVFYAAGGAALVALLGASRWPGSGTALGWITLLATIAACVVGAYIAYPGGRIRHRELRHGDPPAAELQEARREAAKPGG